MLDVLQHMEPANQPPCHSPAGSWLGSATGAVTVWSLSSWPVRIGYGTADDRRARLPIVPRRPYTYRMSCYIPYVHISAGLCWCAVVVRRL